MNFLQRALHKYVYDGAETGKHRRAASKVLKSEDRELTPSKRAQLIANARDLQRNYALAAWAIRKHLDYTTTFSFQAKTGDDALNKRVEELVEWYARPLNCDIAGRFSLQRMFRTLEGRAVLDGDSFLMKLGSGKLQPIEGDRIRDASGTNIPSDLVHGVKVSKAGRSLSYCVANRRSVGGGFESGRMVPARNMLQLAYFDRFDQVRGISPLSAAVNSFQDLYESTALAQAKAKVSQLFALAITRESFDPLGVVEDDDEDDKYNVDFGKGPIVLDMDPGDEAKFLESNTASSDFQSFTRLVIMLSLKALDIPLCMFDEANTNYYGSRQALLQYEQSVKDRRDQVLAVLNAIIRWRLSLFVQDGTLVLPAGLMVPTLKFEWIPLAIPLFDPLKEIKASGMALDLKLTSRQRICKERSCSFEDIVQELAAEEKMIDDAGLSAAVPVGGPE